MPATYAQFFDLMEDLGFFEHIYEHLPDDFTAVFEIARVLEDESHPLTAALLPSLRLASPARRPPELDSIGTHAQVILTDAEEYEAGHIRSPRDLVRIYNSQWLLPDGLFYTRLAKKELWAPYPKEPAYFPVEPDADDYRPDSRKQKLYILLDTSSSMAIRNRINLAKAIVYHVLKRNLRELGSISLRTFDTKIGELHVAGDRAGFHALISFIMRLHVLGNGTAMAKALAQAVHDIRAMPHLSDTEILVVTDGACALDEARMREMLGDDIAINTIKIGHTNVYASKSYIRDKLFEEDSPQHAVLEKLQKKEGEIRRHRDHAESPTARRRYDESLQSIRKELDRQVNAMTEEIVVGYAHELERLSQLYITVDDLDIAALLGSRGGMAGDLRQLLESLEQRTAEHTDLETLRKLALLNDHLQFLLRSITDAVLKVQLEALQQRLEATLLRSLQHQIDEQRVGMFQTLTPEDRHDLQFLLTAGSRVHLPLWRFLVRKLIARLRSRRLPA